MSIPSDNPILLARDLGPSEGDPAVSLAVGDGEIVALTRSAPFGAAAYDVPSDAAALAADGSGHGYRYGTTPAEFSGDHRYRHGMTPAENGGATDGSGSGAPGLEHARPDDATSLLRCLAAADASSSGELWIKGTPVHTLRPTARLRFSHANCAVLPRTSRLLPELSMADNAALPLMLAGLNRADARRRAHQWLDRLEVGEHALARLPELPLAVIRRVTIARALLTDPTIFLADEPLLGLETADRFHLLRILRAASGTHGLTMLIATDDPALTSWADRRIAVPSAATSASTSTSTSAGVCDSPALASSIGARR